MKSSSAIGSAPTQTRSLTFIAMQSIPIVSKRPRRSAITIFVPTPSVRERDPGPVVDREHARVVAGQVHRPAAACPVSIRDRLATRASTAGVGCALADPGAGVCVGLAHRAILTAITAASASR